MNGDEQVIAQDAAWEEHEDTARYMILADEIPWEDSDGRQEWCRRDAAALADMLETKMGYSVKMIRV